MDLRRLLHEDWLDLNLPGSQEREGKRSCERFERPITAEELFDGNEPLQPRDCVSHDSKITVTRYPFSSSFGNSPLFDGFVHCFNSTAPTARSGITSLELERPFTETRQLERAVDKIQPLGAPQEQHKAPFQASLVQEVVKSCEPCHSITPTNTSVLDSRSFLLHHIIGRAPITKLNRAVAAILAMDPGAMSRPFPLPASRAQRSSKFRYPLHMALERRDTPRETLLILLSQAKEQKLLDLRDGPVGDTALMLLLRKHPRQGRLLDDFLLAHPKSVFQHDNHGNTPLHLSCLYCAPIESVRHLSILCPDAQRRLNRQGLTPLDIAQQKSTTDEAVVQFLSATTHRFRRKARCF